MAFGAQRNTIVEPNKEATDRKQDNSLKPSSPSSQDITLVLDTGAVSGTNHRGPDISNTYLYLFYIWGFSTNWEKSVEDCGFGGGSVVEKVAFCFTSSLFQLESYI